MAQFTRNRLEDHSLTRVQDNIESFANEVADSVILNGRHLTGVKVFSSTTKIPHGLGRPYRGFIVTNTTSRYPVFRDSTVTSDPAKHIPLKMQNDSEAFSACTMGSSGSISSQNAVNCTVSYRSSAGLFRMTTTDAYTDLYYASMVLQEATAGSTDEYFGVVDTYSGANGLVDFKLTDDAGTLVNPDSGAFLYFHATLQQALTTTVDLWVF
mgnify:CR=1 FL=1